MTQEYSAESAPPAQQADSPPRQGTADIVRDQAAGLSQGTVQAGKHTADAAREQASELAVEAARQGRDLARQAQDQLVDQAARGQRRLAATLHSLSDQLSAMADGSPQDGIATDLARQAAERASDAGHWLSSRQPAQVVDEVQSFARRRPGVFLALAAGTGLIAGRLTRGMKAASSDDQEPAAPAIPGTAPEAGTWTRDPAGAAYQAADMIPAASTERADLGRTPVADLGELP
jgi:hypothetical protein